MGKIATKTFCNSLKSGAFSGTNLNQCPTKAQIVAAGFEVLGNYKDNQLVQEADISYVTWEYTFTRTDSNSTSFTAAPQTKTFNINSVKQKYVNGKKSGNPVNVDWNFGSQSGTSYFTYTKNNQTTLTVASKNNTSTSSHTGQVVLKQSEGSKSLTINFSQSDGSTRTTYTVTPSTNNVNLSRGGQSSVQVTLTIHKTVYWNNIQTSRTTVKPTQAPSTTTSSGLYGHISVSSNTTSVTISAVFSGTTGATGYITPTYSGGSFGGITPISCNINVVVLNS